MISKCLHSTSCSPPLITKIKPVIVNTIQEQEDGKGRRGVVVVVGWDGEWTHEEDEEVA